MLNGPLYVVDDDEISQFMIKKTVQMLGFSGKVFTFNHGAEALAAVQDYAAQPEQLPHLILLDINMPVMDGWEFLDQYVTMKAVLPHFSPVYILSSSIDARDLKRAQQSDFVHGYVSKPLTTERMAQIFAEVKDRPV